MSAIRRLMICRTMRSIYVTEIKGKRIMRRRLGWLASVCGLGGSVLLGGCAVQPPSGPTVMALPAPGKNFQTFQRDDYDCRNFAGQQTAYQSQGQAGATPGVTGATLGTLGGAALGAAIGAAAGNAGAGAAIGAGTGLIGGASVGSNSGAASQFSMQQRYNIAYTQCMYSRGNSVQSPPPGYAFGAPGFGYSAFGPFPYAVGGWGGFFGPSVLVVGGGGGWRGGGWGGGGWHGGGWGGGGWHR